MEGITGIIGIALFIGLLSIPTLLKRSAIRKEYKIISYWSQGVFHSDMFSNLGSVVNKIHNLLDKEYRFSDEERTEFISQYKEFLRMMQDNYFREGHNPDKRYLKSDDLYLMSHLYDYYTNIFNDAGNEKVKLFLKDSDRYSETVENHKIDYIRYRLTESGTVALKARYATSKWLEEQGLIKDVSNEIRKDLDNGFILFFPSYRP